MSLPKWLPVKGLRTDHIHGCMFLWTDVITAGHRKVIIEMAEGMIWIKSRYMVSIYLNRILGCQRCHLWFFSRQDVMFEREKQITPSFIFLFHFTPSWKTPSAPCFSLENCQTEEIRLKFYRPNSCVQAKGGRSHLGAVGLPQDWIC